MCWISLYMIIAGVFNDFIITVTYIFNSYQMTKFGAYQTENIYIQHKCYKIRVAKLIISFFDRVYIIARKAK